MVEFEVDPSQQQTFIDAIADQQDESQQIAIMPLGSKLAAVTAKEKKP